MIVTPVWTVLGSIKTALNTTFGDVLYNYDTTTAYVVKDCRECIAMLPDLTFLAVILTSGHRDSRHYETRPSR